jgi:hypothetical protein
MTIDGFGGVSRRSGAGPSLALASLDYLQLTRRGMVMELSRTVNYSGLEARVGVAERYRGCHRSRVVCDEVLTAAECVNVVRHSSAAMAEVPLIRLNGASKALNPGLGLRFPPTFYHQQYKNDRSSQYCSWCRGYYCASLTCYTTTSRRSAAAQRCTKSR